MLNNAIARPTVTSMAMKSQRQQFIDNLRVLDPATIRLMTVLIMLGLLLVLPASGSFLRSITGVLAESVRFSSMYFC